MILIAATNRPDVLDPALLRPGRFDRQIVVDLPNVEGREALLEIHARKVKLDAAVRTAPMEQYYPSTLRLLALAAAAARYPQCL